MDFRALKDRAAQLFGSGRYTRAMETYRALIQAAPRDAELRLRFAEACRRAGHVEHTFQGYRAAAELFARAGHLARARAALHQAERLLPKHPALARVRQEVARFAEANSHLQARALLRRAAGIHELARLGSSRNVEGPTTVELEDEPAETPEPSERAAEEAYTGDSVTKSLPAGIRRPARAHSTSVSIVAERPARRALRPEVSAPIPPPLPGPRRSEPSSSSAPLARSTPPPLPVGRRAEPRSQVSAPASPRQDEPTSGPLSPEVQLALASFKPPAIEPLIVPGRVKAGGLDIHRAPTRPAHATDLPAEWGQPGFSGSIGRAGAWSVSTSLKGDFGRSPRAMEARPTEPALPSPVQDPRERYLADLDEAFADLWASLTAA